MRVSMNVWNMKSAILNSSCHVSLTNRRWCLCRRKSKKERLCVVILYYQSIHVPATTPYPEHHRDVVHFTQKFLCPETQGIVRTRVSGQWRERFTQERGAHKRFHMRLISDLPKVATTAYKTSPFTYVIPHPHISILFQYLPASYHQQLLTTEKSRP